jgi:hypothetical protein
MTNEQFCRCLKGLKMTRASAHTARALGLSVRQLQRIVAGETPVSKTLALLVIAYTKRGVPDPLWNPDGGSLGDYLQAHGVRLAEHDRLTQQAIAGARGIKQ